MPFVNVGDVKRWLQLLPKPSGEYHSATSWGWEMESTPNHRALLSMVMKHAIFSKRIVTSHLALDQGDHIVGPFWIHHVQNSGIAFGLFSSRTAAVIVLTGIAVVWMLVFFARSGARHPVLPVALGLVIGGSISNLLDRVRLGYVTDFLDLRYWPAFNLADSFIVIGVGILLVALLAAEREPRRARHVRDAAARP